MFKKFFGPFPDEPLLYCLDRILGLLLTFDKTGSIKNESSDAQKKNSMIIPVNEINPIKDSDKEAIVHMTVSENNNYNATTDDSNKSQSTNESENIEETSHTSDDQHVNDKRPVICNDVDNERITVDNISTTNNATSKLPISESKPLNPNDLIHNDTIAVFQNISSLRKLVKKTSSMECLYSISETKIENKCVKSKPNFSQKKVEKITFTDQTANNSHQKSESNKMHAKSLPQQHKTHKKTESKCPNFLSHIERSVETKVKFEPSIKEKSTCKYLTTLHDDVRNNVNTIGDCKKVTNESADSKTDIKAKKSKFVSIHPKVVKTEWACTRICTFDDNSQTYEVMTKDDSFPLELKEKKAKSIQRIFAISPNLTTVAYRPLK